MKRLFVLVLSLLFIISCQPKQQSDTYNNKAMENDAYSFLVGTYTKKEGHVDGQGEGIYVYEMNKETGAIQQVSVSERIISPSYLTIHPNGKYVYAVNEFDAGEEAFATITALEYDNDTRTLAFINEMPSLGQYPCHISINETGGFVMVANYLGGSVALYPILEEGMLGEAISYKKHEGGSGHPRQDEPHAHQILQEPGSDLVYAVDLGANKVYEYVLDTLSLTLDESNVYSVPVEHSGPRHMAFHPAKPLAYLLNELNGTIEVVSLSSEEKFSKSLQAISTLAKGDNRDAASGAIKLDKSGKYLYATNRGEINEIVVFSIDSEGKISPVQHQSTHGLVPRDIAIDPSGKFLLAANQNSNTIVTFKIDQGSGKLSETGLVAEVPSPVCIKFFD